MDITFTELAKQCLKGEQPNLMAAVREVADIDFDEVLSVSEVEEILKSNPEIVKEYADLD